MSMSPSRHWKFFMRILHIDSSPLGAFSVTRQLTQTTVERLAQRHPGSQVEHLDLAETALPHWNPEVAGGEQAQATLAQFLQADVIVLGAPMYNFAIPSQLKAWIDQVAVAGKTFRYNAQGQPEGLAGGKQVWLVSGRGGQYGESHPMDFQEGYLKTVLGFLGITDIQTVRAEGVAMGEQAKRQALDTAAGMLPEVLTTAA